MPARDARLLTLLAAFVLAAGGCENTPPRPRGEPDRATPAPTAEPLVEELDAARERVLATPRLVEHPRRDLVLRTDRPVLAELLERPWSAASTAIVDRHAKDLDPETRALAALVLAWHDQEAAQRVLGDLTRDGRPRVRAAVIEALGVLGGREAVAILSQAARDEAAGDLGAAAATSLGRLGDVAAVPTLEETAASGSASEATRIAAALALGRLGGSRAVTALAPLAAGAQVPAAVRRAAAVALGLTAEPLAVVALIDAAAVADPETPFTEIDHALEFVTYGGGPGSVGRGGRMTRQAVGEWNAWWQAHGREPSHEWRARGLAGLTQGAELELTPEDVEALLVVLIDSPLIWQRRLAHDELSARAGVEIAPRALYEVEDATGLAAVRAWQVWARGSAAPRMPAPVEAEAEAEAEAEPEAEAEADVEAGPAAEAAPAKPARRVVPVPRR